MLTSGSPAQLHCRHRPHSSRGASRAVSSVGVRASAESGQQTSPPSVAAAVREALQSGEGHPYIYRKNLLSEKLNYRNDFHSLSGSAQYLNGATIWYDRQKRLLPQVKSEVVSVVQLSQTDVIVKWKVSWVRPAGLWLYQLATTVPSLSIEYKDILDRVEQQSKVSWGAIRRVLSRIVSERVVEVPLAVISGASRLQFASQGALDDAMVLVSCKEQLDLVPLFDSRRVKNRTATRDLLLFQLVRAPPGVGTEDWMQRVNERVGSSAVPGMGAFDVDDQSQGQRAQAYEDAASVLGYATFCVLVGGVVIGYTYFKGLARF